MSIKKQLIINIVWNFFHTAWQMVVMVLATMKWSWAGLGLSFAGLLIFNILGSLVFLLIEKARSKKADQAYKETFEA